MIFFPKVRYTLNEYIVLWKLTTKHLLLCLPQPVESFAKITAVVEMRCEDPKPAVFTVVTPVVLPINPLTWRRAR